MLFNAVLRICMEGFWEICKVAGFRPKVKGSAGVDALRISGEDLVDVYAFPPCHLVNRVIYKFIQSNIS